MSGINKTFPKHSCQFCGSERKLVETIIDDKFFWDEDQKIYKPNKFSDTFEHTGVERCADCYKNWTGF